MNPIDRDLDTLIRQIELDEPSRSFTDHVMQAIVPQALPVLKETGFSRFWLLLILPFCGISFWIISLMYDMTSFGFQIWNNVLSYFLQLKTTILYLIEKIGHITVSPLVLAGLVAVVMLLIIDELFNRKDSIHRKAFPKS